MPCLKLFAVGFDLTFEGRFAGALFGGFDVSDPCVHVFTEALHIVGIEAKAVCFDLGLDAASERVRVSCGVEVGHDSLVCVSAPTFIVLVSGVWVHVVKYNGGCAVSPGLWLLGYAGVMENRSEDTEARIDAWSVAGSDTFKGYDADKINSVAREVAVGYVNGSDLSALTVEAALTHPLDSWGVAHDEALLEVRDVILEIAGVVEQEWKDSRSAA